MDGVPDTSDALESTFDVLSSFGPRLRLEPWEAGSMPGSSGQASRTPAPPPRPSVLNQPPSRTAPAPLEASDLQLPEATPPAAHPGRLPALPLQGRFLLIVLPIALVLALLGGALLGALRHADATAAMLTRQEASGVLFAQLLAPTLASPDHRVIGEALRQIVEQRDVNSAAVIGPDGKILAARNHAGADAPATGLRTVRLPIPMQSTGDLAAGAPGATESSGPGTDPAGPSQLLVNWSDASLEANLHADLLFGAVLIGLMTLGLLGGSALAFRRLVRTPLTAMLTSMRASESGAGPGRIRVGRTDEFGAFADAFNRMLARLDSKSRRVELLYHRTPGLLFTLDSEGSFASVSDYFCSVMGHPRERLAGHTLEEFVAVDQREAYVHHVGRELSLGMTLVAAPLTLAHPDGHLMHVVISSMPERDANGRVVGSLCVMTDVTKQEHDKDIITRLAKFDPVTLLPNRSRLRDDIQLGLQDARRSHTRIAILFLDLDRFKHVNDSMGHAFGDELLKSVAQRLQATLRPGDSAARFGGDEFVMLMARVHHPGEAEAAAKRLLNALNQPYELDGRPIYVSASIGIAMYPDDGDDPETLLKHADAAVYRAKEAGRNGLRFYTSGMNEGTRRWLHVETSLRRALEDGGFKLAYQPVMDLNDGRLTGFEALLRMQGIDGKPIPPVEFIPVAEECGLILPIGDWVIEHAIRTLAACPPDLTPRPYIAVNVSPRQLRDPLLPNRIDAWLHQWGVAPEQLMLELTESSLIDVQTSGSSPVHALAAVGCPLALDDFGTGYSSLAYLKRFPFKVLKVDRSFVRGLPADAEDRNLVEAVLAIARTFQLTVVAEGVESAEQAAWLHEAGCARGQGYFFGRPETGNAWDRMRELA